MPRRSSLLAALIALDLGLVVAALNVFLLRRVQRDVAAILLWPKTIASEWIGNLRGWGPHIKEVDPIGFWIQLGGVALLSGIAVYGFLLLFRRPSADAGLELSPGVVAVAVPWICLAITLDIPVEPTEAVHFLLLGSPLIGLGLGIRGCVLVYRNEWRARRLEAAAALIVGSGAVPLLAESVDFYARPVVYASVVIGACLFVLWATRSIVLRGNGKREAS